MSLSRILSLIGLLGLIAAGSVVLYRSENEVRLAETVPKRATELGSDEHPEVEEAASAVSKHARDSGREVLVFLRDGSLAARAEIVVDPPGDILAPFIWTPDNRNVPIPFEGAILKVNGPELTTASGSVTPETRGPIIFQLIEPNAIRLWVTFPEGSDEVVHSTFLRRLAPGERPDPKTIAWDSTRLWNRSQSGNFLLTDVEIGTYLVGVTCRDHFEWIPDHPLEVLATTEVAVSGGIVDAFLEIPLPEADGGVVVSVLGPSGDRRRSMNFKLVWGREESTIAHAARHRRLPDGRFVVYPRANSPSRDRGPLYVVAVDSEYGSRRGPVQLGHPPRVDIQYPWPGTLALRADVGDPGSGSWRLYSSEDSRCEFVIRGTDQHGFERSVRMSESGERTVQDIPAGEYDVLAKAEQVPTFLESQRILIRPGEVTRARFILPALYPFTFLLEDQDGFAGHILHQGENTHLELGYPGKRVELPAGSYELTDVDHRFVARFKVPRDESLEVRKIIIEHGARRARPRDLALPR